ncbi:MAG TPA: hypothetical protein VKV26_23055 [Dehalococcoidia bacterium]|nr:hypothetical protein [Dehalococcoidia bacterium]
MWSVARLAAVTFALTLGSLAVASAAGPSITVKPGTFVGTAGDCGPASPPATDAVASAWVAGQGLPDAGGSNHALYLQKFGATSDCSAALASVSGVSGISLTELGFDVRDDGHCGAGAPRFDVITMDGVDHFFGCFYGTHTPIARGWTRVRFALGDAFPPVTATETVQSIEIVFDEGTDVGSGFVYIDNIDVNGTIAGQPGLAQ